MRPRLNLPAGHGALALLTAALAGCVTPGPSTPLPAGNTPSPYPVPAAGQPQARLLVRAALGPADRLLLLSLQDAERCTQPQLLGRLAPGATATTLALQADRLHTLDVLVVRGGTAPTTGSSSGATPPASPTGANACATRWSFTPLAGKAYLLQVGTVGTACPARLVDTTVADQPTPPADLVGRASAANRCLPLAQSVKVLNPLQGGQLHGEAVLNPNATAKDLEGLISP